MWDCGAGAGSLSLESGQEDVFVTVKNTFLVVSRELSPHGHGHRRTLSSPTCGDDYMRLIPALPVPAMYADLGSTNVPDESAEAPLPRGRPAMLLVLDDLLDDDSAKRFAEVLSTPHSLPPQSPCGLGLPEAWFEGRGAVPAGFTLNAPAPFTPFDLGGELLSEGAVPVTPSPLPYAPFADSSDPQLRAPSPFEFQDFPVRCSDECQVQCPVEEFNQIGGAEVHVAPSAMSAPACANSSDDLCAADFVAPETPSVVSYCVSGSTTTVSVDGSFSEASSGTPSPPPGHFAAASAIRAAFLQGLALGRSFAGEAEPPFPRRLSLAQCMADGCAGDADSRGEAPQRPVDPRLWCHVYIDQSMCHPDLVPAIIGKGGRNTKAIFEATGTKVRVRGCGSGHLERKRTQVPAAPVEYAEASSALMVALTHNASCAAEFRAAYNMAAELMVRIEARFCDAQGCRGFWIGDASSAALQCLSVAVGDFVTNTKELHQRAARESEEAGKAARYEGKQRKEGVRRAAHVAKAKGGEAREAAKGSAERACRASSTKEHHVAPPGLERPGARAGRAGRSRNSEFSHRSHRWQHSCNTSGGQ